MIIFLYGPDSYGRQQKQKEIINQYKAKHSSLSIAKFDLEDDGAAEKLKEFIEAKSLFDFFKLVVIHSPDETIDELLRVNTKTKEVVLLVVSNDKPQKKLGFLIKPPVIFQEFKNLSDEQFKNFIIREAQKRGLSLDKAELRSLLLQHRGNCWSVITELDKLSLTKSKYALAGDQYDLFKEINGLNYGDPRGRLRSLEILLKKEDPAKIFNLVAYSRGFDRTRAAIYDLAVKSGKLDYETALLDLVIRL